MTRNIAHDYSCNDFRFLNIRNVPMIFLPSLPFPFVRTGIQQDIASGGLAKSPR